MPHIPRTLCVPCGREMTINRNGILVEMLTVNGPYYLVYADAYKCIVCGHAVLLPSQNPLAFSHEPDYAAVKADVRIKFSDVPITAEERGYAQ